MALMLPKRVFLSSDALFQDLDGEVIILDLKSSHYFGIDGVGARLWQCLQSNPELEPALNQLADEFDVTREVLVCDISAFLNDLADANLATFE